MSEKPSWLTSTFSTMTLIVVLGLVGLCLYLKDVVTLKEMAFMLLGGYGFKKGMEITQAKAENGKHPEPGPPPPAA